MLRYVEVEGSSLRRLIIETKVESSAFCEEEDFQEKEELFPQCCRGSLGNFHPLARPTIIFPVMAGATVRLLLRTLLGKCIRTIFSPQCLL